MTEQELMYASEEDITFFQNCIKGLPKDPGYSCGAHSVRCFREIIKQSTPLSILEIGMNVCYSTSLWFGIASPWEIVSVDISDRPETIAAADFMKAKFGKRFKFINKDSKLVYDDIKNHNFDLCFIDGGHEYEDVKSDIELAKKLNIKWIAFDDWLVEFGPGVQKAIAEHPELSMENELGNIVLMFNNDYHE